ncbi:hypothetical protein SAMN05216456_1922 [Devosia crocina]|uniref:Uncharacterized protein n=1 Tax=Devosia crocina TaxID=429728 RepID=A0A1I7NF37_9HYPH|nr:hypothetical protein [Devosia crocina]SFV33213.1 hypothetical protein SAMN05216456_1922 [Devosia crocina]
MAQTIDVEELVVWAFRDQKIEAVARGMMPSMPTWSSDSSMAEVLALGTRVDTSSAGSRFVAIHCKEDAAVVFDAVMRLPAEAKMLVVKHARSATRPEWHEEGPGEWVQPLDKKGRPKKLWRDPATQRGYLGLAPKELVGTHPLIVEEARRAYCVWWLGLCDLVEMLNVPFVLSDFVVRRPNDATPPWFDPEAKGRAERVILGIVG